MDVEEHNARHAGTLFSMQEQVHELSFSQNAEACMTKDARRLLGPEYHLPSSKAELQI